MIGAVIMASGAARRMGKNKLLLQYNGKPLILHIFNLVLEQGFENLVVVTCYKEIAEIAKDKNIKYVYNMCAEMGQSQSVRLGINSLGQCDGYMFFTGDQPLLDSETINKLIRSFENHSNKIIVPLHNGKRGNPVIFPKKFKEELLALKGDMGGKALMNSYPEDVLLVEITNEYALWDIDTPEDYEKLIGKRKGN